MEGYSEPLTKLYLEIKLKLSNQYTEFFNLFLEQLLLINEPC